MFGERLSRWERILYITILVLAIASRFYLVGERAMSHDESLHSKYSWMLYVGQGYQHNPMMHGPSLYHFTALAYFLFGVNDAAARLFPALFGIALVLAPLLFRRYLGSPGALIASFLLLISPAISYHSRYIRHDVYLMTSAVIVLWAVLKYLEDGKTRWLYLFAGFFALMYTTMEGYYIYTVIFGALLFVPFALWALATSWERPRYFNIFLGLLVVLIVLVIVAALGFRGAEVLEQPVDPQGNTRVATAVVPVWARISAIGVILMILAEVVVAFYGIGEARAGKARVFDVLMLVGTLILPLGSALVIWLAGVDMLQIYQILLGQNFAALLNANMIIAVIIVGVTLAMSILLGLWWDPRRWPAIAGIFWAVFLFFYTTMFTNPGGALSGLVGALAYWLAQQGVERGGQPTYYYLLMMGIYEYLPFLFSIGSGIGVLVWLSRHDHSRKPVSQPEPDAEEFLLEGEEMPARRTGKAELPIHTGTDTLWTLTRKAIRNMFVLGLEGERSDPEPLDPLEFFPFFLLGWTLMAWVAFSLAGERMPWLTVHITLPSIFLSGWGLGRVMEGLDWKRLSANYGWLIVPALPVLITGVGMILIVLSAGAGDPAAGGALENLDVMGTFLGALVGTLVAAALLIWAWRQIGWGQVWRIATLTVAALLSLITVRTMTTFNYINYDLAREFMVYAHSTPDVKAALQQIDEVSWRVTGSVHDVKVAYGEDGSWPLAWYMVAYPNAYFYGASPDANTLRACPVVIAGRDQWTVVEPILGADYMYFDYKYLWWPIQDYFGLNSERIRFALTDPAMRAAVWEIFWNRDYRLYGQLTKQELTPQTWPLRRDFRLYVRRDLARDLWEYEGPGLVVPEATAMTDPYATGARPLASLMNANLIMTSPRGLALAPDGTLYVTDSLGHKVWHVSPQGMVIGSWGEPGSGNGQFNEPGGVAVDKAGNVYVADTWNHRIQKFDRQGKYLLSWGLNGLVSVDDPSGVKFFYGPRGIAVGPDGLIYVTDTGNKRVQVFDAEGNFMRQFGAPGTGSGQFDEPVGIAVTEDEVFVADSWNSRVQVFSLTGQPLREWSVPVWSKTNPEEKPFLTVSAQGVVLLGDPSHGRVLAFTKTGEFLWASSGSDTAGSALSFPVGMAVSSEGVLYVSDAHTTRVVGLRLP